MMFFRLLGLILLISGIAFVRAESPPLRFVSDELPPYAFQDGDRVAGYSVEIVGAVCQRMGLKAEFKIYPWQRALVMAERGGADGVLNASFLETRRHSLAYTEKQMAFPKTGDVSDHLWLSEYVFFVNRSLAGSIDSVDYQTLAERGYRVGVNHGFSYDGDFRSAQFKRVFHATPAESFRALARRDIDLFACDRCVGNWLIEKMNLDGQVTFIPTTLFSKPYNAVFARHSTQPLSSETRRRFFRELEEFKGTDACREIIRKYRVSGVRPLPRPLLFVCESWKPFEYEEEGIVKGLNAEVVDTIMQRLRIPYEIRIYPWSRAWRMVEKGAADAVLSISYKKTREEVLYYTDEQREFAEDGKVPPDYLWLSEYFFFVKRKNLEKFHFVSYEDMKSHGYRIGTNKGYSYSPDFPAPELSHREFNNTRDGLMALVNEEIDLYPMDRTVALAELMDMGLLGSVTYIPKPIFSKPYLAPFCRLSNYPQLEQVMAAFCRELRMMRASGEYQNIYSRHCGGTRPSAGKDVEN